MLLDARELSEYLHIKTSTIYSWVSHGFIPHYKIGHLIRFKLEEVEEWVAGFKKGVTQYEKSIKKHSGNIACLDIDNIVRKAIDDSRSFKV